MAEGCCQNKNKCRECGKQSGSWLVCDECRRKREDAKEVERFEKAEKLTKWDGWVYLEGYGCRNGYFESVDDFLDWCACEDDNLPEYIWTCKPNHFVHADVSDITGRMDDAFEDFDPDCDLHGMEELRVAIEKFNEANKDVVAYEPDYTKAVLIAR
jgi:hypothetical protein